MVPPGDIGPVPIWVGVYIATALVLLCSNYLLYYRVVRLVRQGNNVARFDHLWQRTSGAISIVLGQRKVLQRVPKKDWAGIGHALIFWGFLSFSLSYLIFIFVGSIWHAFPETLLTATGVRVYSAYLDILAVVLLVILGWALVRRWVVQPRRLSFDLTRNLDSVIVVAMIAALMVSTLLTHGFFVAAGGTGPEAQVLVGGALGRWFSDVGISQGAANVLQGVFWWVHLGIILGFAIYIPFSKHMHMVAAPLNAFFRSLEPRGALAAMDLENAERFGAAGCRISPGSNCWTGLPARFAGAAPTPVPPT